MDIKLGNIGVTSKQIENSHSLAIDPIKGFGLVGDEVVIVSKRDLTEQEKIDLIPKLKALPEVDTEKKNARKARKQSVRAKLNLTKPEFNDFLRGLREALDDGNDD